MYHRGAVTGPKICRGTEWKWRLQPLTALFMSAISIVITIVLGPNASVAFLVAGAFSVRAKARSQTLQSG